MKLSKKALSGIVLVSLIAGVTLGAVLTQWQVQMQVEVVPAIALKLYHVDGVTPFESFDFGSLQRSEYGRTAEDEATAQWLKNEGETTLYLYYTGFAYGYPDATEDIQVYLEKWIYTAFGVVAPGAPIEPGEFWRVRFTIQIGSNVAFEVHSWTTTLEGRDVAG